MHFNINSPWDLNLAQEKNKINTYSEIEVKVTDLIIGGAALFPI